jgi:hypothetical protein
MPKSLDIGSELKTDAGLSGSLYELCSDTNAGLKATIIAVAGINTYANVPVQYSGAILRPQQLGGI